MFGIRKKQASKTPANFAVGLPGRSEAHEEARVRGDEARAAGRAYRIAVYNAKDGWRWRLWAPNGKIVADSGEAYKRRYDAKAAAINLVEQAHRATIQLGDRVYPVKK